MSSNPSDAELFLDWKRIGRTPIRMDTTRHGGLAVVVKDGYEAASRRIGPGETGAIEFDLKPGVARSGRRILFSVEGASPAEIAVLRRSLAEEGFTILGDPDAREFTKELERSGGLSNSAFLGWSRARFGAGLLVRAKFNRGNRDLGQQDPGYGKVRDAMQGIMRSEVTIDLDVVDLRSGESTALVGKGAGFGTTQAQSLEKALAEASSETAKLLTQRLGS